MTLDQKIDLAWYKKTGQMPGGFQKWKELTVNLQPEAIAIEFGVSGRTIERWNREYRKEVAA